VALFMGWNGVVIYILGDSMLCSCHVVREARSSVCMHEIEFLSQNTETLTFPETKKY
jgi:hypothetical protein